MDYMGVDSKGTTWSWPSYEIGTIKEMATIIVFGLKTRTFHKTRQLRFGHVCQNKGESGLELYYQMTGDSFTLE